jgi:hypothetical protein
LRGKAKKERNFLFVQKSIGEKIASKK